MVAFLLAVLMQKIYISFYKTPYGELILGSLGDYLCLCDWRYRKMRTTIDARLEKVLRASFVEGETELAKEAMTQLEEYFASQRKVFNIPLLLAGTDFQKSVWMQLQKIPFGQTFSYSQLSEQLGDKKAVRAVANANGANAISLFIPCHRIIGSDGQLTGYAGGLGAKEKLLQLESSLF